MNELVRLEPQSNVAAYRASTEAAELCKEIVVHTSSNIQGRRYVSVEGWQAIARAHGCAAGACDVEYVETGVRAIGEVRDILTGSLIARAEGFVGQDEPTWYGGQSRGKTLPKRPDYAIRAMAQTRAMSRACRSAFAHVVVMMNAGLATTPAEEVPSGGFDDTSHNPQTGEVIDLPVEKIVGIHAIKQRLNQLMRDGNKIQADEVGALEAFNALVRDHKDDLQTIKDGNHAYWTGDGDDFEGFRGWIKRLREEMTEPEESLTYKLLVSNLNECTSLQEMTAFLRAHGDAAGELDGEESRTFERLYDEKAEGFKLVEIASV